MIELINKDFPPIDWVINELIPEESIVYISGYPGCGKSWTMLEMAIKISQGGLVLNHFQANKAKVLFVDEENGIRILQRRLKLLTRKKDLDIEFISYGNIKFIDSDRLTKYCLENEIKVVFMDSFVRFHSGDENNSNEMSKIYESIKEFKRNGLTLIIAHHTRKSENKNSDPIKDLRGSSEIVAAIDCGLAIKKTNKNELTFYQTKLRIDEERSPFTVELVREEDSTRLEYINDIEVQERQSKVAIAKMKIMTLLGNKKEEFRKSIIDALSDDCKLSSIKQALKELEQKGSIQKEGFGAGNTVLYKINN